MRGEQKWRAQLLFTGLLRLHWQPAGPPRGCVQARCGAERARARRPLRKGGSLPFHQGVIGCGAGPQAARRRAAGMAAAAARRRRGLQAASLASAEQRRRELRRAAAPSLDAAAGNAASQLPRRAEPLWGHGMRPPAVGPGGVRLGRRRRLGCRGGWRARASGCGRGSDRLCGRVELRSGAAVCGHALAVAQVVSCVHSRCARVAASRSGEGTRGVSTWR